MEKIYYPRMTGSSNRIGAVKTEISFLITKKGREYLAKSGKFEEFNNEIVRSKEIMDVFQKYSLQIYEHYLIYHFSNQGQMLSKNSVDGLRKRLERISDRA